jgi:hypothetical protein
MIRRRSDGVRLTVETRAYHQTRSALMLVDVLLQEPLGRFRLRQAVFCFGTQGREISLRQGGGFLLHPFYDVDIARDGVAILL